MEEDLKTMHIVRGKIIMAMADLRKTSDDPKMLQILRKALNIIEKRIFEKDLPQRIKEYKGILKK